MLMGSWAKRTFSKETLTFALGLASLFLVLGLLFYWVHMALQSP
jgi:cytochrome c biogenesis protein CcdA